jgi:hypothetical protein
MESGFLQPFDATGKIRDAKNDAIPSARLLTLAVGHRTRTRRSRAAQQKVQLSERDVGEGRELLMLECEPEMLGVERDGTTNVAALISNTVEGFHATLFLHVLPRKKVLLIF